MAEALSLSILLYRFRISYHEGVEEELSFQFYYIDSQIT